MFRIFIYFFVISFFSILSSDALNESHGHRSGCHAAHSCPSDTGSYVCGDKGIDTYCGNDDDEDDRDEKDEEDDNDGRNDAEEEIDDEYFSSEEKQNLQHFSNSKFSFEPFQNGVLKSNEENSYINTNDLGQMPIEHTEKFTDTSISSNLAYYSDSQLGVSLSYPSDWVIRDIKKGFQILKEDTIYVEIRLDYLEPKTDLTKYVSNYISEKQDSRTDFDLILLKKHILSDDTPAYIVEYTFTKTKEDGMKITDETTMKIYRILIDMENNVYNFAYVSDSSKYNKNFDLAKKIIGSIQISENFD